MRILSARIFFKFFGGKIETYCQGLIFKILSLGLEVIESRIMNEKN